MQKDIFKKKNLVILIWTELVLVGWACSKRSWKPVSLNNEGIITCTTF